MNRHGEFKRRHQRRNVRIGTWMMFPHEDGRRVTYTVDLTQEGARFASERPVELRSLVLLRLQIENPLTTIECKGRVCWSRHTGDGSSQFGIRFLDLTDDEQELLERYLAGTVTQTADLLQPAV